MKSKETFKTKEQVEKDGNINLSVGKQPTMNLRMIGGIYDGVVQKTPALKGLEMIKNGKAEEVGPKVKVIEPPEHEREARRMRDVKKNAKMKLDNK